MLYPPLASYIPCTCSMGSSSESSFSFSSCCSSSSVMWVYRVSLTSPEKSCTSLRFRPNDSTSSLPRLSRQKACSEGKVSLKIANQNSSLKPLLPNGTIETEPNLNLKKKEGIIEKIPYELRASESVDDNSLS